MVRKIYLMAVLGIMASLASCNQSQKTEQKAKSSLEQYMEENGRFDTSMQRTSSDSTAVITMTTQFLDMLSKDNLEGALDMLYDANDDELLPISQERRQQLQKVFKTFPVLSYKIDGFDFYSDDDSQVRYTYHFMEGTAENIPTTTTGVLNFYRRDGKWYLSVPKEKTESL